nr:MAG TPA: hypothetical protein [Caudoviricetes sp.]
MKMLINKAFFLFSASLIRLFLPQITAKNASQNASMQVKMQVKFISITAKNPRITTIEVISGDEFYFGKLRAS